MFGNLTNTNNEAADIPFYKQINSIGDNINTENEVHSHTRHFMQIYL